MGGITTAQKPPDPLVCAVKAMRSDQSWSTTAAQAINFGAGNGTIRYDIDGAWSAGNPTRFVAKTAGVHRCTALVRYLGGPPYREVFFKVNGAIPQIAGGIYDSVAYYATTAVGVNDYATLMLVDSFNLNANDYVEVFVDHSGGSLQSPVVTFTMERVPGRAA